MAKKYCRAGFALIASLGALILLAGCGKNSSGLSQTEVQQLKNAPAPGSTPPPEARAALQRMQSGAKGGPPPAAK